MEKFLSTKEVADVLQVKERTVVSYIKDKRLRAYKLGRKWRLKEADVYEFLHAQPTNE